MLGAICPRRSRQAKPRVRVLREKASQITVVRKVDTTRSVSFAGTGYRAGNQHIGKSVEVSLQADTVQIKLNGIILRTHRARHDKKKELGAFANPGGRPIRRKAS